MLYGDHAVGPGGAGGEPEHGNDNGEAKVDHRSLFVYGGIHIGEENIDNQRGHGPNEGDNAGEDKELCIRRNISTKLYLFIEGAAADRTCGLIIFDHFCGNMVNLKRIVDLVRHT